MATIELTSQNFSETVAQTDTLLIDFWADWCQPCRRFGPVFEAASEKHDDIVFAKLDTQNNTDIAGALNISSIPTLMALKGGVLVYNEAGALNAPQLDELITQLKALDVEAVKQAQAASAAGAANDQPANTGDDPDGQPSS